MMGMELVLMIVGPIAGTVLGTSVFFQKRMVAQMDERMVRVSDQLEEVYDHVTSLRVALPERYVSKDEFVRHVRSEELWQQEVLANIRELREEVIVLRVTGGKH